MRGLRRGLRLPDGHCSFCGQEVAAGEVYWCINGWMVCEDCLPDFARMEYAPFCHIYGEENRYEII